MEFNVVPFGLSTSSAALIRALDYAIGDLHDFVIPFVDDLLCISTTFDEHIMHLAKLFDKAVNCNFTLSFKKSHFFREEVTFLGHILTKDGIRPHPDKISVIVNFKEPKNIPQLQSILGFLNFFAKFVKHYAHETIPLLSLLKKGVDYVWDEEKKQTFQRLKLIFAENLVLKFADPLKPYILTTDASEYAIGAMLSQLNNEGDEEIVIFISRTLKGSEKYYFTTEKEMLAVVWALNKLDTYLRGAVGITIRTDHEALIFLRSCRYGNARLRRWALPIQDYDITLEHIPGKRNVVADYLSRHIDDELITQKKEEILVASIINNKGSESLRERFRNLQKFQEQDPKCMTILASLEANDVIPHARFRVIDNVLCKKSPSIKFGFYKVIVPEEVAKPLILEVHETYAHIGKRKVQKVIEEDFFIFRIRPLLSELLDTCDSCQRNKNATIKL